MKQVIGIYCGCKWFNNWDEKTVREQGAGGSETWAVELADVFQRWGFHVIIFGQPEQHHFSETGVEYVPWYDFEKRCEYQHFDYFISSRLTYEITPNISCDNIYVMCHDTEIENRYDTPVLKLDRVKKIVLLSEWQKRIYLANYSGLTEDRIFITSNGVDMSLYQNIDYFSKENAMAWSSCKERGLNIFINKIYPKIKESVPDFKLYICDYNDNHENNYTNIEGIEFVGKLSKKELADLQKRVKIWIYPNYGMSDYGLFHETFCITAVENALAGNAISCFNAGGIATTLYGYPYLRNGEYWFNNLDFKFNSAPLDEMLDTLAKDAVRFLKEDTTRVNAVSDLLSICGKYTWEKCAKDWLKEWGLDYGC